MAINHSLWLWKEKSAGWKADVFMDFLIKRGDKSPRKKGEENEDEDNEV